jgi:predicted metalloprotease
MTGGFMIPLRPSRRGGLVWGALLGVIAVLALVGGLPGGGEGGIDLKRVLEPFPAAPSAGGPAPRDTAAVGRDVQQTWKDLFRRAAVDYRPAKLVVFDRVKKSECGLVIAAATSAFYCRSSSQLQLNRGLDDPYLIAHVYAHHVQELLGITDQVARAEEANPRQARELWRSHELQADCLAGVWAHSVLEARAAAAAIGLATVPVDPDHVVERGSWASPPREERADWFRRGYESGLPRDCNAFAGGES